MQFGIILTHVLYGWLGAFCKCYIGTLNLVQKIRHFFGLETYFSTF